MTEEEENRELIQLPLEVWSEIILFCGLKERMNLSFTCKSLLSLVDQKPRLKQLFKQMVTKISVVPSDCTNWAKACKIKQEYETLTEAINSCVDGDRVYIPPGVYDFSETSPLLRLSVNRLKICGLHERELGTNGIGSITYAPDTYQEPEEKSKHPNTPAPSDAPSPKPAPEFPKLIRTTRIIGSNVPFISHKNTITHLTIKDIEFILTEDKDTQGIAIMAIGLKNLKIKRCGFTRAYPLHLFRCERLSIRNCHFYRCRSAISISSAPPNFIILLLATGQIRATTLGEGVFHKTEIDRCVIENCTGYGISLVATSPKPKKSDASSTEASSGSEDEEPMPESGVQEERPHAQDLLTSAKITNCRIRECEHSGINVDGLVKVEFSENKVSKCFHGMTFKGACRGELTSNRIVDNRYEALFSVNGHGRVKLLRNHLASSVGPCLGGWPVVFEVEGGANVMEEKKGVDQVCREAIRNKVCTIAHTGNEFYSQFWWNCETCGWGTEEGLCVTCRKVCHKGHEISQVHNVPFARGEEEGEREEGEDAEPTLANFGLFYCDCGAKGPGFCKCLGL